MTPPGIGAEGRFRLILGLIGLGLAQAGAAALAAFATRALFSALASREALPMLALAALALSGAVAAVARFGFYRLGESLGQSFALSVRLAIFEHGSRMRQSDIEARRVGYQSLRFVGDLSALKDWPARGLPALVEAGVVLPVVVVCLFLIHPGFGWAGLSLALVCVAVLAAGARPMLQAHRRLRAVRALLAADLSERLPIAPALAGLGRRKAELRLLTRRSDKLTKAAVRRVSLKEALRSLPETLTATTAALVFWLGWRSGADSGTIAAGLALLGLTARPLRGLTDVIDRASAFRAAHLKLTAALQRPENTPQGQVRLASGPLQLEIEALLPDQGPVRLAPGDRVGLPPGVDADRVFRAILGQEPGGVRLNGVPVQDLSPGSLRRGICRISATPVVLKGSLRRSLTLGLTDRPSDADILARLAKQKLSPLVQQLGGLDRRLTEGARGCSRADRLAISVLQAALQRPGLLLISDGLLSEVPLAAAWVQNQPATLLSSAAADQ